MKDAAPPSPASPAAPAPAGAPARARSTLPIRWHLVVFAALILLPQIALGLCIGWWYCQAEHKRLEASAVAAAAAVSDQLDRQLGSMKAALQALATSPNATGGDFWSLRRQAESLPSPRGAMMAVRDRDGLQLMNTLVDGDRPVTGRIDPVLAAADRQVFDGGGTAVSGLFKSAVTGDRYTAVVVPLIVEGQTPLAMSMAMPPAAILDILIRTRLPASWTITVLDAGGHVVARSRDQARFLGQKAPAPLWRSLLAQRTGVVPVATGLDGTHHFAVLDQLDASDWRVVVGVPLTVLNAPFRILAMTLAAFAILALGVSAALARFYSLRLEREVTSLQAMAAAVGTGGTSRRRPGSVRELEAIAAALRTSDASLLERNRTRDLLLAELNHRVRNTLSVLLSVVNHTIRSGGDDALARKTAGRIMALSRAHDLLSHAEWSAVPLSELVRRTGEEEGVVLAFEGAEIPLRAEAVAPMAQVLHELTVNQRRHGLERRATLRVAIEGDGARLVWILPEPGIRRSLLPGFGLRLVRMGLERQLFGRIERLDAAGLEAVVPLAFLSGDGSTSEPFAARWRAGPAA